MQLARYIYAYRALDDLILIYPLYGVLFAAHGLSPLAISILFIIWSAVSIVAEVPSGVLADRYSRRKILIIGQLIRASGYLAWLFFPTFWGYALGFVLWGVGGSFASGTFEALVYDELKRVDSQKLYLKIIGRAESFALGANLLATVLASAALLLGYNVILLLSAGAVLLSALPILLLPEARREKTIEEKYWPALKRGVHEAVVNPIIRRIVVLGGVIGAIYGSTEEYVPLLFKEIQPYENLIPILVAVTVLMAVVASMTAYRYERLRETTFVVTLVITGLLLVVTGASRGVTGVALVALFTLLIKGLLVIYDAKLQHSIESDLRATITSVSWFLAEVVSIGIYFGFGLVADKAGYAVAFGATGVGVMLFGLLFFARSGGLFRPIRG